MTSGSTSFASRHDVPGGIYLDRFNVGFYLEDALSRVATNVNNAAGAAGGAATASSTSAAANASTDHFEAFAGAGNPLAHSSALQLEQQLQTLADYFGNVLDGKTISHEHHTIAYLEATPWNRRAFVSHVRSTVFARLRRDKGAVVNKSPPSSAVMEAEEVEQPRELEDQNLGEMTGREEHAEDIDNNEDDESTAADVAPSSADPAAAAPDEGSDDLPEANTINQDPAAKAGVAAVVGTAKGNEGPQAVGNTTSAAGEQQEPELVDFQCTMADFHALLQAVCADYPADAMWRDVLELLLDEVADGTEGADHEAGGGATCGDPLSRIGEGKFSTAPETLPSKGAALEAWKQCSGDACLRAPVRSFRFSELDLAWAVCFVYQEFVLDLRNRYRQTHVLARSTVLEMIQDARKNQGEAWLDYDFVEQILEDGATTINGQEVVYTFKDLFCGIFMPQLGPHCGLDRQFSGVKERETASLMRQRLLETAMHEDEERRRRSREKKMSNTRKRRTRRN
ncbi:unnamed protein product [Amoebophrya sp. A120]|nr:unnamed protein product [Amoebophrya sp. A120]|eukprot:GSA120T00007965001.1